MRSTLSVTVFDSVGKFSVVVIVFLIIDKTKKKKKKDGKIYGNNGFVVFDIFIFLSLHCFSVENNHRDLKFV